ncbi:Panacea domain-containing protein [Bacillus wiedmannii]|uniref:Panacea domain-containing protein n=1 Tax=Bacillus wiedmannii TaxID=1890302 RepID=UPI0007DAEEBA|nr:type II toxin-antitoxin system antitoxin SocA domain-containing protein [Bacillus wiedmannii]OAK45031.1 hypothetical protein A6286_24010 [Bacillus wiedmannii]
MARVLDAAKYLINKSTPGSKESITNLKLQKLLYYAQGFHLALKDHPLFEDELQAWVHGPVVSEVYHTFKNFSYNDITCNYDSNEINLTRDEQLLLDDTWEIFKQYSGKELEMLTHEELPWQNAREGLSEYEYSENPIDINIIRNYFIDEYIVE